MSYYGGYASYTSYAATSYSSTSYDYNNSYDANSCYATGQYIQNLTNYNQEVRYGSYGNQCSNWQNTASTIMLWHLFVHQSSCRGWEVPTDKTIEITLEVDANETAVTGFTDGVLAFLEQIGGHVCLSTNQVNITLPDSVHQIDADFLLGLLVYLIEPLGINEVKNRVTLHSPHAPVRAVYDEFFTQFETLQSKNRPRVEIIKQSIAQAQQIDEDNTAVYEGRQKSAKVGLPISTLVAVGSLVFARLQWGSLSEEMIVATIAVMVVGWLFACYYLAIWMMPGDRLCRSVLNTMAEQETILAQLHALDEKTV